ncbi:MAG: type II toxin-antitoxin system HicB family antitoxin [Chloroflexota bacterium]
MSNPGERYSMVMEWSDDDQAFIVTVPELPGCRTHGRTYEDAVRQGQDAIESWLDAQRSTGRPIPPPRVCRPFWLARTPKAGMRRPTISWLFAAFRAFRGPTVLRAELASLRRIATVGLQRLAATG